MENKEEIIVYPVSFSPLIEKEVILKEQGIEGLEDIPISITAELGTTKRLLNDVLKIKEGTVLKLDKSVYEPCEVFANGKRIAKGQIIINQDKLAIRITKLLDE